jgi:hypothetical protein
MLCRIGPHADNWDTLGTFHCMFIPATQKYTKATAATENDSSNNWYNDDRSPSKDSHKCIPFLSDFSKRQILQNQSAVTLQWGKIAFNCWLNPPGVLTVTENHNYLSAFFYTLSFKLSFETWSKLPRIQTVSWQNLKSYHLKLGHNSKCFQNTDHSVPGNNLSIKIPGAPGFQMVTEISI